MNPKEMSLSDEKDLKLGFISKKKELQEGMN